MDYQVGDKVDLTFLNSPQQQARRAVADHVKSLPNKLIPGTKVSFLRMAQGLMVMSIIEPPVVLTIGQ